MDAVLDRGGPRTRAAVAPVVNGAADQTRTEAGPVAVRAWWSRSSWILLILVILVSAAVDLWSKQEAFRTVAGFPVIVLRDDVLSLSARDPRLIGTLIPAHEPVTIVPSVLDFSLVLNPGAVFGIGPGRRWFFMLFTGIAVVAALAMFGRWTTSRERLPHVGIGLLIGGGLGNLYDRMVFGCVRDFIHPLPGVKFPFGWSPFGSDGAVWPYVSNVADLFLLIGIGLLAIHLWRKDAARHRASAAGSTHQNP